MTYYGPKELAVAFRTVRNNTIKIAEEIPERAVEMPTLGMYTNAVNPGGALAPAPNGGAILSVFPDGSVMLYDANADTFTVSRKDLTALSGSYAAAGAHIYV